MPALRARAGAFGAPIGEFQAIQFKLADMEARTHTARLAYYHAAAKLVAGEPVKKDAAIAKLVSSNAAMDNARDATQIFGGYGFMNEFPVGRFYRDAKILEIGEGTSEVQRMLIARELGVGAAGGRSGWRRRSVGGVTTTRSGSPPVGPRWPAVADAGRGPKTWRTRRC